MTERQETLNPWIKALPVRIDIWVMPWASRSDLMLQLQLSYMLSRDDFWTKQSYLRVCSIVGAFCPTCGTLRTPVLACYSPTVLLEWSGDFSELGYDAETDLPVLTKAERHAELHEEVWRRYGSLPPPPPLSLFSD